MKKLIDDLTKLLKAGYRLSETKSEFFKTETEWIGHKINQSGNRPLHIYGKQPIKHLTDQQALEPLIKGNPSKKSYTALLTRWLDRLAHFTINVNHIAGKHLSLKDTLVEIRYRHHKRMTHTTKNT